MGLERVLASLEIRPHSFGTHWVPVGYSLGWNPGKAPEIAADAVGKWEDPGRSWGGKVGLFWGWEEFWNTWFLMAWRGWE